MIELSASSMRTVELHDYIGIRTPLERLGPFLDKCESPIERILAEELFVRLANFFGIETQFSIRCRNGIYRADVAIIHPDVHLVVEADGHDYHEKTKEQATRDKKRDRELLLAGWTVMRFTGSEIVRDVERCGSDVQIAAFLLAGY